MDLYFKYLNQLNIPDEIIEIIENYLISSYVHNLCFTDNGNGFEYTNKLTKNDYNEFLNREMNPQFLLPFSNDMSLCFLF